MARQEKEGQILKVLDLFCGAGGFSSGFQEAGFEICLGVDDWKDCKRTFQVNHPEADFWLQDINQIDPEQFAECIKDRYGKIDVLLGSPPCVEFSTVNPDRDPEKGLELVKAFLEIVDWIHPRFWIMENTHYAKKYIRRLVPYQMRSIVINAADFGVPQIRKRCFFGTFPLPEPTHTNDPYQTTLAGNKLHSWTTLGEVLESNIPYGFLNPHQEATAIRLKTRKTTNQGTPITPVSYPDKLDRPSRVIMASIAMSNRSTIMVAPNGFPRNLTFIERSRVQGFPRSFKWFGSATSIRKQIGNAVCPPVALAFAKAIMKRNKANKK